MARDSNRVDDGGIRHYDRRPEDLILRALAKGMSDFKAQYGRNPKSFYLTQTAYDDLESKFPENHRGVRRIFFGMTMRVNNNAGLNDDQYEFADLLKKLRSGFSSSSNCATWPRKRDRRF